MKRALNIFVLVLGLAVQVQAQGTFGFANVTAPTRLGAVDGPLAGPGIWAQPLAGSTADSLSPLYVSNMPVEHFGFGYVNARMVTVPWAGPYTTIFVQLVAWDGTVWGTNLASVPLSQLGFTDKVSVYLVPPDLPQEYPMFTQPAIVPTIPEPTVLTMLIFGGTFLLLGSRFPLGRSRGARFTGCKPKDEEPVGFFDEKSAKGGEAASLIQICIGPDSR